MADTGNPWFIPFAEPSDLVRDWPALSSAVGTAVAAGLSAAANAGIGSNVVQTVKTDTFSTSSTSFTAITGLSATITPSTNTSKILIVAFVNLGDAASSSSTQIRLTGGNSGTFIGNASGSRTRVMLAADDSLVAFRGMMPGTGVYLDSPTTTSPVTYGVQMRVNTGTGHLNRQRENNDNDRVAMGASSITVIEVAA
jgi:hypothetical protein